MNTTSCFRNSKKVGHGSWDFLGTAKSQQVSSIGKVVCYGEWRLYFKHSSPRPPRTVCFNYSPVPPSTGNHYQRGDTVWSWHSLEDTCANRAAVLGPVITFNAWCPCADDAPALGLLWTTVPDVACFTEFWWDGWPTKNVPWTKKGKPPQLISKWPTTSQIATCSVS